ncbi:MAG: thiamine biosynthesis protein ThiJ [Candidatus Aenigmarchaeota archaeon ex4484_56]|nr:MAG: thiamine biosynthesis protein ThiJ [Candidatus Aenigmarchaeota archaeon ex4484_56]
MNRSIILVILICIIFLSGCTNENINKKIMVEKKILMVVAPENFRDEEFLHPKEIFDRNGIDVVVASKGVKEAKGTYGATAKVDLDIGEVNVSEYDAVVFVGGSGSSIYYTDTIALNIARETYNKNKVIGAICIAPGILAKSGILEGKKATIWDSGNREFIKILEEGGAEYTGKNVEQDGKIITANGPHAAREFGERIVDALS